MTAAGELLPGPTRPKRPGPRPSRDPAYRLAKLGSLSKALGVGKVR